MSELETRLSELLHEPAPRPVNDARLVTGARGYAVRVRRIRVAAAAAAMVAVLGVGVAVASGAFRDRALTPAGPDVQLHGPVPFVPGASWVGSVKVSDSNHNTFTFTVDAAITAPGTSAPSKSTPGKTAVTGPTMAGSYTLTNTTANSHDLSIPVVLLAYWKVPAGFCDRYDHAVALAGLAVPRLSGGQELCPMALGDSTLATTPQTLQPNHPVRVTVHPATIGLGQDYPLQLSSADAAEAVRITGAPPAAWAALDQALSTTTDTVVTSTGLPTK